MKGQEITIHFQSSVAIILDLILLGLGAIAEVLPREVGELTGNRYNREGRISVVSGDIMLLFLTPGFG